MFSVRYYYYLQLRTAALRLIVRSWLNVPTFATRRLHACHHARAPSGGKWNCGREMSGNFAWMPFSTLHFCEESTESFKCNSHKIYAFSSLSCPPKTLKYSPFASTLLKLLYLINTLNAKLNPICYLVALLGVHHILHVSRIRVNILLFVYNFCSLCIGRFINTLRTGDADLRF